MACTVTQSICEYAPINDPSGKRPNRLFLNEHVLSKWGRRWTRNVIQPKITIVEKLQNVT